MSASRSSVEDGDTRKIRSSPWASETSNQVVGLVGRQVGGDEPGTARRGEVAGEGVRAVVLDEVPVGHDHGRGAGVGDRLDGGERVARPDAALQRPGAGALHRHAVHHRVAVGQSDLDEVDARADSPSPRQRPQRPRSRWARRGSRRAGSRRARRGPGRGSRRRPRRCGRGRSRRPRLQPGWRCSQLTAVVLAGPASSRSSSGRRSGRCRPGGRTPSRCRGCRRRTTGSRCRRPCPRARRG